MSQNTTGAAEGRSAKADAFEALDPAMIAKTNLLGTVAIVRGLLEAGATLDEDGRQALIRHLATEIDALDAALEAAWDTLVRRGGNK